MTDVTLKPFGINLALGIIGAYGVNQNRLLKQKALYGQLASKKQEVEQLDETLNMMTENMIDKRFNVSKEFLSTHDRSLDLKFKKSISDEDKLIYKTLNKQLLRAKTQYDNQYSTYNKNIQRKQTKQQINYILKKAV